MRAQTLFNRAVRHLGRQREKALTYDGVSCMYLAEDGLKCAVGGCVNQRQLAYLHNHEGDALCALLTAATLAPLRPHQLLLEALQTVHDDCDVRFWADELQAVAEAHDLDPAVVDEAFA